eukprot:5011250-Pleurochrysis_carterae.AAC.1
MLAFLWDGEGSPGCQLGFPTAPHAVLPIFPRLQALYLPLPLFVRKVTPSADVAQLCLLVDWLIKMPMLEHMHVVGSSSCSQEVEMWCSIWEHLGLEPYVLLPRLFPRLRGLTTHPHRIDALDVLRWPEEYRRQIEYVSITPEAELEFPFYAEAVDHEMRIAECFPALRGLELLFVADPFGAWTSQWEFVGVYDWPSPVAC